MTGLDPALREAARAKGAMALITVAGVSGSTPRSAGSRMALLADGRTVGTVGGGKPEARAMEEARACLAAGLNGSVKVEMTGAEAKGADLICGGVAELWIEVVTDSSKSRPYYAAAAAAIERGEAIVILSSETEGCVAVLDRGGRILAGAEEGRVDLRRFPVEAPDRLLILGGGHVGLALARSALALSFATTVADPRPEYSDAARFPAGVECLRAEFTQAIEGFPFGPSTYVVIVSPGHLGDLDCARAVLSKEYRYAGLIGSRRKCRMLIEALVAEGLDSAKVEALRAPIGLDIGAETPEEIAVAICAELIAVRRNSASLAWIDEDRIRRRAT